MTIRYVLFIILANTVLIFLLEKYKKRKIRLLVKEIEKITDLMDKEEYSVALSKLTKIRKTCPPVAYEMMGNCYYGLGDKEKAYKHYLKSLSIDRTMSMSHVNIAKIEMENGAYDQAEITLKKAIEIDDKNYMAPYYLAKIYNIWGRYSEAANLLEKAIEKGLIARDVFALLQDTYASAGNYTEQKRVNERLEFLDKRGN